MVHDNRPPYIVMSLISTEREVALRSQIDDLKRQILERKQRQEELQVAINRFPPRESLAAELDAATTTLQATEASVEDVRVALEPLRAPEERAYALAARIGRLEAFCDAAEKWIETELAPTIEADIRKESAAAECEIAACVEELQIRRDDALEKLSIMRERIRVRASDLRRGFHREAVRREPNTFDGNPPPMLTVERSVSPRAEAFEEVGEETYELSSHNAQLGDELSQLQDRLRRLQKLRSKYHSELLHYKQDSKKSITALENSVRQVERGIARDHRLVQQLHASNGALTSTLQMVMSQLNVEHYGTQVGPTAIEQVNRRQDTIAERQQGRHLRRDPFLALTEK